MILNDNKSIGIVLGTPLIVSVFLENFVKKVTISHKLLYIYLPIHFAKDFPNSKLTLISFVKRLTHEKFSLNLRYLRKLLYLRYNSFRDIVILKNYQGAKRVRARVKCFWSSNSKQKMLKWK